MEEVEVERSNNNYSLQPLQIKNEDILFCIDIDPQSMLQMKKTRTTTTTLTRLEAIKQAILLFVNSKLIINPNHRFAFVTLSDSVSWVIHHSPFIYLTLFSKFNLAFSCGFLYCTCTCSFSSMLLYS
jgi:hypothetical protein